VKIHIHNDAPFHKSSLYMRMVLLDTLYVTIMTKPTCRRYCKSPHSIVRI
jgi:hypothetical protein